MKIAVSIVLVPSVTTSAAFPIDNWGEEQHSTSAHGLRLGQANGRARVE